MTIGHGGAVFHFTRLPGVAQTVQVLRGGHTDTAFPVVRLTDGRYLRFLVTLYLGHDDGYLRTSTTLFQYQLDEGGRDWVFRYEYARSRRQDTTEPACHFHVRGSLVSKKILNNKQLLERVHFPCGRPTIESTIRCLIDEFGVPPTAPEEIWRPTLADSEKEFALHAHHPETERSAP